LTERLLSLHEIEIPDTWKQKGTWISIGTFDGVHLGHQALVQSLVAQAHGEDRPAILLTFYPHPAVVLRGVKGPYYITPPDERSRLLQNLGVDRVLTLEFNRDLASLSAFDFMNQVKEKINLCGLLVGYNFALGHGREGDLPRLREIGEAIGYQLQVIAPIETSGSITSSSQIRGWIAEGSIEQTTQALGRFFSLNGVVSIGDGRGRILGIPTANLTLWDEQVLPANGVYACWANIGSERKKAVVNIGLRPTFEAQPLFPRVEAHLLDFDRDIYDQELQLEFVSRLRGEKRFSSIELLIAQINHDKEVATEMLEKTLSETSTSESGMEKGNEH
jgi:riboflavin kinase/FMN adenylyltransferase